MGGRFVGAVVSTILFQCVVKDTNHPEALEPGSQEAVHDFTDAAHWLNRILSVANTIGVVRK
jgi:hypothetical protein